MKRIFFEIQNWSFQIYKIKFEFQIIFFQFQRWKFEIQKNNLWNLIINLKWWF